MTSEKCPEAKHCGRLQLPCLKAMKVTEWRTVTLSVTIHGSGQKKYIFHILNLTILKSYIPVVLNSHSDF